jgi:hypothetical protein
VAIDGTGAVVTAYTYKIGSGPTISRTSSRAPSGGWQPSPDLSSTATGAVSANPAVATNAAGASVVAWDETGPATFAAIQARAATTAAGNWGATETVDAASHDAPAAAIGNDGTAVAAWENQGLTGNTGQASVRSPGASGTWSDIHDVTSSHANATSLSLSTDGLGDFATISAPFSSTLMVKPATVSVYDAAPPTLAPPTFAGGSFAGLPITMTTTAYDAWSTITGPLWTFGDGFTATGLTVTHAYSFGDYLANVIVTDAAGNSARRDFIANAAQAEATIQRGAFRATWKRSRVTGTLALTGTVPDAGAYRVVVSRLGTPGRGRVLASLTLGLGPFTRSIRLPATLLPGSYVASLDGDSPFVDGPGFLVKLAAPAEGVVDLAALSRTRAGKAAKTLTGASAVWARFHFAAIPKGKKLTVTWYRTVKGKRVKVRTASKKPVATVRDSLGVRGRRGTVTVVLTRAGKVIFQSTVRLK